MFFFCVCLSRSGSGRQRAGSLIVNLDRVESERQFKDHRPTGNNQHPDCCPCECVFVCKTVSISVCSCMLRWRVRWFARVRVLGLVFFFALMMLVPVCFYFETANHGRTFHRRRTSAQTYSALACRYVQTPSPTAVLGDDPRCKLCMNAAAKRNGKWLIIKIFPANCWAVINELTFGERQRKVEGKIIYIMFAYMNMQKIIIPTDEGQKRPSVSIWSEFAISLPRTHSHTFFLSLAPKPLSSCLSARLFVYLCNTLWWWAALSDAQY